jgi:mono/diheme cytochrome c family protein
MAALLSVLASAPDTREEKGKAAYARAGCEMCHGAGGNGKGQGPALVPFTLELPEFITIVRQGVGLMPGTPRDRVSDAEIAEIRSYLISLSDRDKRMKGASGGRARS